MTAQKEESSTSTYFSQLFPISPFLGSSGQEQTGLQHLLPQSCGGRAGLPGPCREVKKAVGLQGNHFSPSVPPSCSSHPKYGLWRLWD